MSSHLLTRRADLTRLSSKSSIKSTIPPRHAAARFSGAVISSPSDTQPPVSADANERLYEQLAPLIRRLIRQYGKTLEMRQDLSGELYCRFCALLELYDPERGVPLRPYLIRQLNAAAYSYARQQWRLENRMLPLETNLESAPQLATEDPTPAWISALSQEQVFAGLPHALASLPTRQRQAVILRYYDDYSFEEIAAALEVQSSTARSLLRHGLNKLRLSLAHLSHECV